VGSIPAEGVSKKDSDDGVSTKMNSWEHRFFVLNLADLSAILNVPGF